MKGIHGKLSIRLTISGKIPVILGDCLVGSASSGVTLGFKLLPHKLVLLNVLAAHGITARGPFQNSIVLMSCLNGKCLWIVFNRLEDRDSFTRNS